MEARDYRCCMCPQWESKSRKCKAGPGKPEETDCDFVVTFIDSRGWLYQVMGDLAGTYKGFYQKDSKKGDKGWKGMQKMDRRETFDQAQEDLNQYARKKGLHIYQEEKADGKGNG